VLDEYGMEVGDRLLDVMLTICPHARGSIGTVPPPDNARIRAVPWGPFPGDPVSDL